MSRADAAGGDCDGGDSWALVGYAVVFVADHFIRPILIGSTTRLPFLWVLLGIFGGLETFGVVGIFLGPAIMSVLVAMWREGAETTVGDR